MDFVSCPADRRRAALQVQMWEHLPEQPAAQIWPGVGRPLAQRPAAGQRLVSDADSGPAASGVQPPGGALQDAAFPRCAAVRSPPRGPRSGFGRGRAQVQRLPRRPGAERGADRGGGPGGGVDGVGEQEDVGSVSVLQRGRGLRHTTLSERRSLQGGWNWRWGGGEGTFNTKLVESSAQQISFTHIFIKHRDYWSAMK